MDYQDALAELGVGSAHPGGIVVSHEWIHQVDWSPSLSVLEVGCGTGRTLLDIKQRYGCDVTGVDVRPRMIEQAKRRAEVMRFHAKWEIADAQSLPFPDESFDFLFTESVNVFLNAERAVPEYARVLRKGGRYVDVEMMVRAPVTDEWRKSVYEVYGANYVPDQSGWRRLYERHGFRANVLFARPIHRQDLMSAGSSWDAVDLSAPDAHRRADILEIMSANASWMQHYADSLGYGVFICEKT